LVSNLMRGCSITDECSVQGIPGVLLENDYLRVVVLVGKGTDVYEFRHKQTDTDVLYKSPWGVTNPQSYVQDSPDSTGQFMDFYHGGWQELFPNAGNSCIYKGAALGFHGEICKVPWSHTIREKGPKRVSLECSVRTVRTPFLIEKTLFMDSEMASLRIRESVTNQGSEPLDFMWGHHPAFGAPFLSEHCRLFAPCTEVETSQSLPARQILRPNTEYNSFPFVTTADGRNLDLSRTLPSSAAVTNLTYLKGLTAGWYCFINERTRQGFAMKWDVSVFRYIWLWQEFGGTRNYPWWGQGYVVGIEPHSSLPSLGLNAAIERGTQLNLQPGATISTTIVASVFEAEGIPTGVTEEGQVVY
jgi:hypothetical protein